MNKYLLGLLLFTAQIAAGQTELFHVFGRPYRPSQNPYIVSAAEKGHFWVAGEMADCGESDILLAETDSTGTIVRADTLGDISTDSYILDFKRDSSSGVLWLLTLRQQLLDDAIPNALVIHKFDENGHLLLEKHIANAPFGYVQPISGGGVVVAAAGEYSCRLIRLAANADQVWATDVSGINVNEDFDQLTGSDSGTIIWTTRNFNNQEVVLNAFAVSDGALLWQNALDAPLNVSKVTAVGACYNLKDSTTIAHYELQNNNNTLQYVFTKVNAEGTELWQFVAYSRRYTQGLSRQITVDTATNTCTLLNSGGYVRCDLDSGYVVSEYDFHLLPLASTQEDWSSALLTDSALTLVGRLQGQAHFARFDMVDSTFSQQKDLFTLPSQFETDAIAMMTTDEDGNYFVANYQDFEGQLSTDVILRKFNAVGDLAFQKTFFNRNRQYPQALTRLQDGHILLMSFSDVYSDTSKLVLQKINALTGDLIWEKRHLQPISMSRRDRSPVKATTDNGVIVVLTRQFKLPNGEKVEYQTCAIRFSALGDTVWAARYLPDANAAAATSKRRFFTDMEWMPDGSLLAIGEVEMAHGFGLHFNAVNGQQIAAFEVNPGIFPDARLNTVVPISMTEAIVHANPRRIMRISTVTGQVLHFEFLYFNNGASQSSHLFRTPDGRVMGLFGNIPYHPDSKGFRVVEIRENDLSILSNTELREENLVMSDAVLLPDCGIAAVGPFRNGADNDLYLTKIAPVCTSVEVVNPIAAESAFEVHPNPLAEHEALQISLENDFLGKVKFEVFSLNGQRLGFFVGEKNAREQVFEWKNVPGTGPFLLRMSDGKNAVTRLVIR
ncbi:MAG: hypothetical protein IT269_07010 [Saprospiraceae bacterium]|nr:hypothetical protein [Saprospiraceae bacterium]